MSIEQLKEECGFCITNEVLLHQAITHKSFTYEMHLPTDSHNEKLEFLGDAVLGLLFAEWLMEIFPRDKEGNLSKKRASLVNVSTLSQVAMELGLAPHIQLGRSERSEKNERDDKGEVIVKPRILASVYEALVGALFLDQGILVTGEVVRRHFLNRVEKLGGGDDDYELDYKTRLQVLVQQAIKKSPTYWVKGEKGPPHKRLFHAGLRVREFSLETEGWGTTKKEAEQVAAKLALEEIAKEKLMREKLTKEKVEGEE